MEDNVLTTTDTAKLLGISVRTVQLLIESGGLPSWKTPGGHRRVHRSDVELLMEQKQTRVQSRSATALVVAKEERVLLIQRRFEQIGYVALQFVTSTWSAAIAAGDRPPAIAVIDLESWKDEGVALLRVLATDSRLKNTELVTIAPEGVDLSDVLPPKVRQATLETIGQTVGLLTADSRDAILELAGGGFPIAPNEASRLLAVQRSGLVHTPAEAVFDRVTWLAASALKSPIALMTVLTPEAQWFKSRQGLEMAETPRSWAFCNHTVLNRGVFEVDDLAEHPSFASNPAVAESPHFRFYAGAPVYDPDGFALGSICVIDFRPRHLEKSQKRTLLELAAIASDEVKLREVMASRRNGVGTTPGVAPT